MKKLVLSLFALASTQLAVSQFVVSPNPFNINSGMVTVTYGSEGDFSLYQPNGATTLYLYTGLETDNVIGTWEFHDNWIDTNTLIPMVWDAGANAFIGSFHIGGRLYMDNTNGLFVNVPFGTIVNDWYFIIRNLAGNSQSGNLQGTNYGFDPNPSLSAGNFNTIDKKFFVTSTSIVTNLPGKSTASIYSISGALIQTLTCDNRGESIEIPHQIKTSGTFIAVITNNGQTHSIKFVR